MNEQDRAAAGVPAEPPLFGSGDRPGGDRVWLPVALAVVVVLILAGVFAATTLSGHGDGDPAATAYASSLAVTGLAMSNSGNLGGGQETYLDGTVTNHGHRTVHGITVSVTFRDFSGNIAAADTAALTLIRSRQPYIDVEPVSAAPIGPGESRPFRVAFDTVPDSWNQSYPQVRVIGVRLK